MARTPRALSACARGAAVCGLHVACGTRYDVNKALVVTALPLPHYCAAPAASAGARVPGPESTIVAAWRAARGILMTDGDKLNASGRYFFGFPTRIGS